jgi:hypothetical protein
MITSSVGLATYGVRPLGGLALGGLVSAVTCGFLGLERSETKAADGWLTVVVYAPFDPLTVAAVQVLPSSVEVHTFTPAIAGAFATPAGVIRKAGSESRHPVVPG